MSQIYPQPFSANIEHPIQRAQFTLGRHIAVGIRHRQRNRKIAPLWPPQSLYWRIVITTAARFHTGRCIDETLALAKGGEHLPRCHIPLTDALGGNLINSQVIQKFGQIQPGGHGIDCAPNRHRLPGDGHVVNPDCHRDQRS